MLGPFRYKITCFEIRTVTKMVESPKKLIRSKRKMIESSKELLRSKRKEIGSFKELIRFKRKEIGSFKELLRSKRKEIGSSKELLRSPRITAPVPINTALHEIKAETYANQSNTRLKQIKKSKKE